jgi:SAM-dependent methyltransferase
MTDAREDVTPEARRRRALRSYLREAPLAAAVWRSNEAAALSTVPLAAPVLDVGCGFGEFGRIGLGYDLQIDLGIDIDRGELLRAREAPYRSLVQCDARSMPIAPESFASAFSVSTLEHIPDVARVFGEVARVLRPGAAFAFTVPLEAMAHNFIGGRITRLAGRRAFAAYESRVNALLTHVNVWPAEHWIALADGAGLRVERQQIHVSPAATMAFETLLPAAFASRMVKRVTGHRIPHPAFALRAIEPIARRLVAEESGRGSNLLVVARKP